MERSVSAPPSAVFWNFAPILSRLPRRRISVSDDVFSSPVRLIAFHSGKYEFAEVRLDAPLHLMGANNVGKTSLIAMLQFLYLDNQKAMHFSHSLPETRRHY